MQRSGCPINAAVEVLGDPWSMLVLRDIMFGDRRHFNELLQGSQEGIASNILSSRLKQLVAAGLLTREDAGRGRRAAYSLQSIVKATGPGGMMPGAPGTFPGAAPFGAGRTAVPAIAVSDPGVVPGAERAEPVRSGRGEKKDEEKKDEEKK